MVQMIRLERIRPSGKQPRKRLGNLDELAASIKKDGLLEPVVVRPSGNDYELICGERRWRACKLAGLEKISAVVRQASDEECLVLALVENLQRASLLPTEEAESYQALIGQGYTQEAVARIIGKTQSYVAHKLRLLRLPEPLIHYLDCGALTENHIRQVAKLKGIYGTSLLRELNGSDATVKPESAHILLYQLRPEEHSFLGPSMPPQTVADGLGVFLDYVSKHNGAVPQWVVAAFWWSSMAVCFSLPVADLALALRSWMERYDHALAWWSCASRPSNDLSKPGKESKLDREHHRRHWGYYADLRHSGSLERNVLQAVTNDVALGERLMKVLRGNSWIEPSCFQPWARTNQQLSG